MGFRNYVKRIITINTNVRGWSGWDLIKDNAQIVKNFASDLKVPTIIVPQTFEEAMKQHGLSESDIQKQIRTHFITACICVALSVAAFLWMFHLLFKGMFLSGLVSFSLSALMAAYGFREHFAYFQLKKRRLNCSVGEWASSFFPGKR